MPVKGAEVADVHTFEDVLLMRDGTLYGIRQSDDSLPTILVKHAFSMHPTGSLKANGIIGFIGAQVQQILFHTAHRTVDGHIIIIKDDKQVVGR